MNNPFKVGDVIYRIYHDNDKKLFVYEGKIVKVVGYMCDFSDGKSGAHYFFSSTPQDAIRCCRKELLIDLADIVKDLSNLEGIEIASFAKAVETIFKLPVDERI
jgi:hypothetical protein